MVGDDVACGDDEPEAVRRAQEVYLMSLVEGVAVVDLGSDKRPPVLPPRRLPVLVALVDEDRNFGPRYAHLHRLLEVLLLSSHLLRCLLIHDLPAVVQLVLLSLREIAEMTNFTPNLDRNFAAISSK